MQISFVSFTADLTHSHRRYDRSASRPSSRTSSQLVPCVLHGYTTAEATREKGSAPM